MIQPDREGESLMKQKRIFALLLAVLFCAGLLDVFVVSPRTLRRQTALKTQTIFLPHGMADHYHNFLPVSIDVHQQWEYTLSKKEVAAMEADAENGVWHTPDQEEWQEICATFFSMGAEALLPAALTSERKNVLCCIYDVGERRFLKGGEGALLGWTRELHLYDRSSALYLCVLCSI